MSGDFGFRPPTDAVSLFVGEVMHARMTPVTHRFSYRVFSLLLDLDQLGEAGRASRLFSANRPNLVSFEEADHGPRDGSPLRAHVDRLLAEAGLSAPAHRVLLLCYPRIAGLVFNPLSVYFAYDGVGALIAVVYEVRNTFGEMHSYVAPVRPGEMSAAGLRQARRKRFYVSPFNGVDAEYRFRIRPPTAEIAVRILQRERDVPVLAAAFHGRRRRLTSAALLAALASIPLLTLKVVAGIHWEALRLWIKGLRLVPRPDAPPPASFGDDRLDDRAAPAPVVERPASRFHDRAVF